MRHSAVMSAPPTERSIPRNNTAHIQDRAVFVQVGIDGHSMHYHGRRTCIT